jgi:hypothetical protein
MSFFDNCFTVKRRIHRVTRVVMPTGASKDLTRWRRDVCKIEVFAPRSMRERNCRIILQSISEVFDLMALPVR